ncbi:TPA_exp: Uncharacterized protein A8136_6379 [Trichophyton benhamiae CBS 112371]|uniref:Uncharacterized protein n=1 Tax=Arthroderma benhamiae (strain ATCC MYA-4681 / CBS 112371) TaxID=663331 RepID=D4B5V6_ARTBC|nr:uncharacterized protein ARB_03863 [Trichophyton benhamiae CBS 112371]EFE29292.1 hypothetical protein ARB_03863 [Trichophyton benhamiae CBS 112371]DAA72576.1 TPA_exp: Uncharacterized protein A8136_6379 [Trichophyton benhamiae CBS 112371]
MHKTSTPLPSSQHGSGLKLLNAKDVSLQPLTGFESKGERHVKSSSLHNIWFTGEIKQWNSFEDEVLGHFSSVRWDRHQEIIAYGPPDAGVSEFHIDARDHYVCGEELSISGRFVQHALQPMSAVSKILGLEMVFGDWKATSRNRVDFVPAAEVDYPTEKPEILANKGKGRADAPNLSDDVLGVRTRKSLVPDYALMVEANGTPRAVGEAKTPWNHNFMAVWEEIIDDPAEPKFLASQTLGQIGNYMIELELKFGFLTNYQHTFFLKREVNKDEKETIYCSNPILYKHSPMAGSKISVRQGLLFLVGSSHGENAWYAKKLSETNILKREKGESMKNVRDKFAAVTKGKMVTQTSARSGAGEDLASDFARGLSLGEEPRRRAHFMDDPEAGRKKPGFSGSKRK